MTDKQILKKAMEKAIKNGWSPTYLYSPKEIYDYAWENIVIFEHDFAKAFFGREKLANNSEGTEFIEKWQECLQQMVLEVEPIKYLEKFLKE